MNILLLTSTLHAGGAEMFVVRLANALTDRGHRVTVAVMHAEKSNPALIANLSPRVACEQLALPSKALLWKLDGALRRLSIDWSAIFALQKRWLRALIARTHPEIVHSHLADADRLATHVLHGEGRKIGHILTLHGDYLPYESGHTDPQFLRFDQEMEAILKRAQAVVAITARDIVSFSQKLKEPSKLSLIYNGYSRSVSQSGPSREELGFPEGKFLFGLVARGIPDKGWTEAIEAFKLLDRNDAALVLVGEGPAIDDLREQRLPNGVILPGFAARPLDYIAHFDVGMLPTYFPAESLPTSVIEYLCCGKPVIATDVGEIAAMITTPDGHRAGELIPLEDGKASVRELADAMKRMIDDPKSRQRMAGHALGAFEKFDMDKCVAAYEHLYGSPAKQVSFNPSQ